MWQRFSNVTSFLVGEDHEKAEPEMQVQPETEEDDLEEEPVEEQQSMEPETDPNANNTVQPPAPYGSNDNITNYDDKSIDSGVELIEGEEESPSPVKVALNQAEELITQTIYSQPNNNAIDTELEAEIERAQNNNNGNNDDNNTQSEEMEGDEDNIDFEEANEENEANDNNGNNSNSSFSSMFSRFSKSIPLSSSLPLPLFNNSNILQTLQSSVHNVTNQVTQHVGQLKQSFAQSTNPDNQLNDGNNNSSNNNEVSELISSLHFAEKQNRSIVKEYNAIIAEKQTEYENNLKKKDEDLAYYKNIAASVQEQKAMINTLSKENQALKTQVSEQSNDLQDKKQQIDALLTSTRELSYRLESHDSSKISPFDAARSTDLPSNEIQTNINPNDHMNQQQATISKLMLQLQEKDQIIKHLESSPQPNSTKESDNANAELINQIENLKVTINQLNESLKEKENIILNNQNQYTQEISSLKNNLQAALNESNNRNNKITSLENEVSRLKEDLAKASLTNDETLKTFKHESSQALQANEALLEKLKQADNLSRNQTNLLNESKKEVEKLLKQREEQSLIQRKDQEQIQILNKKINQLQTELEALTNQTKSLTASLSQSEEKYQALLESQKKNSNAVTANPVPVPAPLPSGSVSQSNSLDLDSLLAEVDSLSESNSSIHTKSATQPQSDKDPWDL